MNFTKGEAIRHNPQLKESFLKLAEPFARINDEHSAWKGPNYNWAEQFDRLGGICPLGINADYIKYGLGRAVIEAAEYYLQQRRKEIFFIDWTDLILFYEKLGYTIWKEYGIFVKQVD